MAKAADPEGARTVGVLTKLDLMDKGTDAMPILLGRSFPLRRGWTAVVNRFRLIHFVLFLKRWRSQQDITTSKSISSAQQKEKEFFENHSAYSPIADKCGSTILAQKCNQVCFFFVTAHSLTSRSYCPNIFENHCQDYVTKSTKWSEIRAKSWSLMENHLMEMRLQRYSLNKRRFWLRVLGMGPSPSIKQDIRVNTWLDLRPRKSPKNFKH